MRASNQIQESQETYHGQKEDLIPQRSFYGIPPRRFWTRTHPSSSNQRYVLLFAFAYSSPPRSHRRFILPEKMKLPGRELDCCNECKCSSGMSSCTCEDRTNGGCIDGCRDCRRDHGVYTCYDLMQSCPESCNYDYDEGSS